MEIIPREGWGARPADYVNSIDPTRRVWLHHFASEHHGPEGMRAIQNFHMDEKGWSDFAYSFAIDTDGTIYEGRGALRAGGHTKGDNFGSHAIVWMGNFAQRRPTQAQIRSTAWLLRYGKQRGWWTTNVLTGGHRDAQARGIADYNGTQCPGDFAAARISDVNRLAREGSLRKDDDMSAETQAKLDTLLNWQAAALGIWQDGLDRGSRTGWPLERFNRNGEPDDSEPLRPAWIRWILENNLALDKVVARTESGDIDVDATAEKIAEHLGDDLARSIGEKLVD